MKILKLSDIRFIYFYFYVQGFELKLKPDLFMKLKCILYSSLSLTCFQDEISRAGGQVLIVSFGERAGALQWIEETHCPFDMVVDEKREVKS